MSDEHACETCGGLCPAGDEICPTCGLTVQVKKLTELITSIRAVAYDDVRPVPDRLAVIKRIVKK